MPNNMPEDISDKMSEDISDRMLEDLSVLKAIDDMVGIIRNKEIIIFLFFNKIL